MYEEFLVESGVSEKVINKVRDKVKNWKKEQWLENKKEADTINAELVLAVDKQLDPGSAEVQALIKKHYQMTCQFWTPNRESYIGLSQLYGSHPDFVKYFDNMHPKLLDFLSKAMKIFAEKELS